MESNLSAAHNLLITHSFVQLAEHATSECDYRDKLGAMRLAATVYITGKSSFVRIWRYDHP